MLKIGSQKIPECVVMAALAHFGVTEKVTFVKQKDAYIVCGLENAAQPIAIEAKTAKDIMLCVENAPIGEIEAYFGDEEYNGINVDAIGKDGARHSLVTIEDPSANVQDDAALTAYIYEDFSADEFTQKIKYAV